MAICNDSFLCPRCEKYLCAPGVPYCGICATVEEAQEYVCLKPAAESELGQLRAENRQLRERVQELEEQAWFINEVLKLVYVAEEDGEEIDPIV